MIWVQDTGSGAIKGSLQKVQHAIKWHRWFLRTLLLSRGGPAAGGQGMYLSLEREVYNSTLLGTWVSIYLICWYPPFNLPPIFRIHVLYKVLLMGFFRYPMYLFLRIGS